MANFTWSFDAPTGTYKQRHLSANIYQAAVADSLFCRSHLNHARSLTRTGL